MIAATTEPTDAPPPARALSPKQRFLRALRREPADGLPAAPHWWGWYKYEATGRDPHADAWREGDALADVYTDFYEAFRPDWFHLHIGTPRYFQGAEIVRHDGRARLVIAPAQRDLKRADRYFSVHASDDEDIVDFPDYILGSRARRPKVNLTTRARVDDYIARYVAFDRDAIVALGYTDHVRRIAARYGGDVFLAVHIPSAICEIFDPMTGYLGFEGGLMAFYDHPDGMRRLLERCYAAQLEWAAAFAEAGAHAFIVSESYISPDLAAPAIYRDFMKGVHRDYFAEIDRMGLAPMVMFWGNINPILEDLTEINVRALLIEESKKTFSLDVPDIRRRVEGRVCLFGNLDSAALLHDGAPEDIVREVRRQTNGVTQGFVMANGSPIIPGTPAANVRALMRGTRDLQRASS